MNITKEHLKHVETLGYVVKVAQEDNLRGVPRTFLVGRCPSGHNIKSEIRKNMQVPSCKECYYISLSNQKEQLQILEGLGYRVTSYIKKLPSGKNKIFVKGHCAFGHEITAGLKRFMLSPGCKKCGTKKRMKIDSYAVFLKELGYKVDIIENPDTSSDYKSIIFGTCPNGHAVSLSRGFVPNPRCNECYNGEIRKRNLLIALEEDYKVEIVIKKKSENSIKAYFTGECPNGHPFEMQVVDFVSGARRCSPCKKDAIIARVEQAISEADYDLRVERGASKSKDRDSRLYVVGTCPNGHEVSMSAKSFENGARCKGCAKYGFSTGRSAVFYLISGSNITVKKNSKARDGIVKEVIVKYGVFHPGSGRLMIHGSRGFNASPLFSLYHTDSKVIAELEKRVGELLAEMGVKTCKEIGLSFDGATESFLQEKLEIKSFITSIKRISKEIEAEYGSNFQTITTKEAMVIGDRSRSVATKNTIAKTIYSLDTKKTDKPKTKKRPKGYAHV